MEGPPEGLQVTKISDFFLTVIEYGVEASASRLLRSSEWRSLRLSTYHVQVRPATAGSERISPWPTMKPPQAGGEPPPLSST